MLQLNGDRKIYATEAILYLARIHIKGFCEIVATFQCSFNIVF